MQAGKKTVGQMLLETEREHQRQQIEVGEFVESLGKDKIMPEVWRQINERRDLPEWQEKFYIVLWMKKNTFLHRVLELVVHTRHTQPSKEWGLTCFSFDPKEEKLKLEWVLPKQHAVHMFLKNKDYMDPFLIHCIEAHLAELRKQ